MGRMEGKVAVITGGGGGIGKATAERFAEEGARVAVLEIDEGLAEAAAASARGKAANSGGDAIAIPTDVTDRASVEAAVAETLARFGRIDVLHNNAGGSTMQDGPVTEAPEEEFWRVIKLDLYGTFLCSKLVIPEIIKAGSGSVINMSSNVALMALPGRDCYTAAKGRHCVDDPVDGGSNMHRTKSASNAHRAVGDVIGSREKVARREPGNQQNQRNSPARPRPADPYSQHGGVSWLGRVRDHDRADPVGRQRRHRRVMHAIVNVRNQTPEEKTMAELINRDHWEFSHNKASEAEWTPGLREIFEYRDSWLQGQHQRRLRGPISCAPTARKKPMPCNSGTSMNVTSSSSTCSKAGPSSSMRGERRAAHRKR